VRAARLLQASLATVLLCSLGGASSPGAEDVIVLGAPVSLTGKYALNGANTKNGYDLAVHRINDKGGVTIGGRPYRLVVHYYDDDSTPARGTELAEQLVKQDGVKFMLGLPARA
jgi:branched-chain amino acid transport system substrate-binding protein